MRPDGLNALSVGHPDIIHVGEIVICLTRCTVANDMELGDRYAERVERLKIEGRNGEGA